MNTGLALFASLGLPLFAGASPGVDLGSGPSGAASPAPASILGRSFGLFAADGELGAVGPRYKARFTGETFEFTPALGARAPKSYPVAFSLESIRLGASVILEAGAGASPVREGDRLRIARGAGVVESYEARLEGVEISWLFESLPSGTGDLVVRGRLTTELAVSPTDGTEEGIRFETPGLGGISWGGVTGIDANGATAQGTVRFDGTHLEMALPGEFVARATFPLLLDPLVGSTIVFFGGNDSEPDVAYDASNDVYLAVWRRTLSATDSFVLGQRFLSTGALFGPVIVIAGFVTTAADPAVAGVNAVDQFLVVYRSIVAPITLRARAVNAFDGTMSGEVTLATSIAASPISSDVGGDVADLPGSGNAVVVWGDPFGVFARSVVVPSSGTPVPGAPVVVSPVAADRRPAITKHGGAFGQFLVTWERLTSDGDTDVLARVVDLLGNPLTSSTTVSADLVADEELASCATQDGTNFMVVYGKQPSGTTGDSDVVCRMLTFDAGAGNLAVSAESTVAGGSASHQVHPAVEFAASKYLVAWSATNAAGNYDLQMQGVAPAGCLPCEPVVTIDASITNDEAPALGAKYSGGFGAGDQAVLVWQSISAGGVDGDAKAQRVEAVGAGGAIVDLGGGCGGGGMAVVSGPAAIGNAAFSFMLAGAAGPGTLVFSAATANLPCGPCTLVPTLGILIPGGPVTVAMPIPCDLALLGGAVIVQWIVAAPSACPSFPFISLSNALDVSIGV